jgi:rod shape-determining protein MreC
MEERTTISSSFYLFLILAILSVLLIFLDRLSWIGWLHQWTEKVANPVKQVFSQSRAIISIGQQPDNPDPVILQAKIDYLQAALAKLELDEKSIKNENEALKKQLGITGVKSENLLPAKNLSVLNGLMTIDKGQSDGVGQGAVVVSGDILIGRVTAVSAYSAKVTLPIYPNNKISVIVLPSKEKGVLRGLAEGRVILEQVLQKADLANDQIVATDGRDGVYPPDLPVGKIANVIKDDAAIYKTAEVKPLVDYSALAVVMIQL